MQQTPPPKLKSIRRKQFLYQSVQEEIKSYILKHHLVPGDAIPTEHELAQQLAVSRNSVREAVKSLEALGILESRAGSGLYVRSFSFDSILNNLPYGLLFDFKVLTDLLEVRMHIETGMMKRVSEQVTQSQLNELQRVLDHMRVEAEQGVYAEEDDRIFHQILYHNVDNDVLSRVLDIFWLVLRRAQDTADIPLAVPIDVYERHAAIARCLGERDVVALTEAMQRHYIGILSRIERFKLSQSR